MKVAGFALAISSLCVIAMPAMSQEQAPPSVAADATPSQAPRSAWQPFSNSSSMSYLIDMGAVTTDGGITRVQMARVSKARPASDLTHGVEHYSIRCADRQYRNPLSLEYGPDGRESDRYDDGGGAAPTDGPWDEIRPNTNVDFIRQLVCERQEPNSASFASIAAYIAAGRP